MSEEHHRQLSPGSNTPPVDKITITRLAKRSRKNNKTGCQVWKGTRDRSGYGQLLCNGKRRAAHRVAYEAHFGPIPDGLLVCHVCDNRPCIAIEHLFLGTHQDNTDDMRRKGRQRWGTPLLNAPLVAEMKRRFLLGESAATVAKTFGKPYTAVYAVKRGQTWQGVPPAAEPPVLLSLDTL